MKYKLYSVLFIFIVFNMAQNEMTYQTENVVVTSSHSAINSESLARNIYIISGKQIEQLPVHSVTELLKYVSAVDIRQRGAEDVQSDVSIRGGTFDQTLILVDGIRLNDSQTGHHNMNIPVSVNSIERIEVLKGSGSSIYGPDAFNGVINIITKKNSQSGLYLSLSGGEHSYYNAGINASLPVSVINNHFTFSKKKSDGYKENTNFDIYNVGYTGNINLDKGIIRFSTGYVDKKFGANGFYSSKYINQWEHTKTRLINGSFEYNPSIFSFNTKIFNRKNDDEYLLDYKNPAFYRNVHSTVSNGAEFIIATRSSFGKTTLGFQYLHDKIESSNLGKHDREKKGLFLEQNLNFIKNVNINFSLFAYKHTELNWKYWPGLDLAYRFGDNFRLFANAGKAFRIPTFTDLYYKSPTTIGNPGLKHEEVTNYETGLIYYYNSLELKGSIFVKNGYNIIDYVRKNSNDIWKAENILEVKTNGFELESKINLKTLLPEFALNFLSVNYTYLNIDKESKNFESRYALDHLKHRLVVLVENDLPADFKQSWTFRYEKRNMYEEQFLTDMQISRKIGDFNVFLNVNNLFDKIPMDIFGISLPGRWIKTGINFTLE